MHEVKFINKNYKMTAYLKNSKGLKITVDKCIEIQSKIPLPVLKDFKSTGNLYFPVFTLNNSDNNLFLLIIDSCNIKNIRTILNKILPTVFDSKVIQNMNIDFFLFTNRLLIISMARNILGDHEIVKELTNNLESLFLDEEEFLKTDEIFSDELILKSDDLIDF